MAARDEIVAFADDLLQAAEFDDYAPVGLQVAGSPTVTRLACGVSASLELFRHAGELGAELLLVHHGMFWDREPRVIDERQRARLEELFAANMSLVAYHLCLDAHPTLGNNALLADALGMDPEREPFSASGWEGSSSRRPRRLRWRRASRRSSNGRRSCLPRAPIQSPAWLFAPARPRARSSPPQAQDTTA